MRKATLAGLATTLLFLGSGALAHTRFISTGSLPPRNAVANKTGPCGSARTNLPTFLNAGQSLTVQFEEFIDHPGYYRIAFSPAGDMNFDQNVLENNIVDLQGGSLPHQYTRTITVPNTVCDKCTMQVIQYMTESNPPSLYHSCADIVILPQGTALPTPNPSPTPTGGSPSPGPSSSSSPSQTLTPPESDSDSDCE